jgi:hypothetical protein
MVTQRRYSVTGQTPPDDAEAMKARSPKLQALDTSVPSTTCGLCGGTGTGTGTSSDDGPGAEQVRGRKAAQAGIGIGIIVRTSSKRSATQLPSPSSPSRALPPKIRRGYMDVDVDVDIDIDTDTDSDVTDVFCDHADEHRVYESQATSALSSPGRSPPPSACSLPDAASLQKLQLNAREDDEAMHVEAFALSPSHSRNQSLDEKHALQQDWAAFQYRQALHALQTQPTDLPESQAEGIHLQDVDLLPAVRAHDTPTFLTLPPEIRHHVYRNCDELVFKQPLLYCIATAFDKIQHPLASVSRLVRSEALAIFYSYNIWTIKVEFRMMYESFQHWIIRLGEGAGSLRLVDLSVRGTMFKPKRTHTQSVLLHGQLIQITPGVAAPGGGELYSPPDGDASFKIDLSEKHAGGKVQLVRNDGTTDKGEEARLYLETVVGVLWEKRKLGTLNGQDWVTMVDNFISFVGGW